MPNVTSEDFTTLGKLPNTNSLLPTPHTNYWGRVLHHIMNDRVAILSLVIILAITFMTIFYPLLGNQSYDSTNLLSANLSPRWENWFGTDAVGRDLWARVWIGTKVSLLIGIVGAILPQLIGIFIGSVAGYFGGWVDIVIMAFVDVGVCIPSLVYLTLISLWIGSGPVAVIIAIAISSWMDSARVVRSRIIQFRRKEFVLAAKIQGASPTYLVTKHIFPNIIGQIIVSAVSAIPSAIFFESYLSFIGLGIASPLTSLGQLCKTGVSVYRIYPYQFFIPGAVISITTLAFYVFGNGLRDAFDPYSRQVEIHHG